MGDTAPIRPEERFDEARVAAHLRRHLGDLVGDEPIEFAQFPGGKANLTFVARAGDTELVLRRPPLGPVAPGSHDMAREHSVLSVLHGAFHLAPQAYHYCADSEVMGKPFFVMERRHGRVVREHWPDDVPGGAESRRGVAEELVDALGALHQVDFEALGLSGLGRPDGFVGRQLEGWTDRWDKARHDEVPAMERLAGRLRDELPAPQRSVILHNDFKLDNVMLGLDAHLVAIFDWDMSTLGDPLVDLGTMLAYWAGPDDPIFPLLASQSVSLADVMSHAEIIDRYSGATGLDLGSIRWYTAMARFRIAVILQQIYIRFVRGQTTDDRFAPLGAIVPPLAEGGLSLLEDG